MEGYYQETGRAGRDGGDGYCLDFFTRKKDVEKLTKFMKDKPVAEREIGTQILKEVIDYSESAVCRRKTDPPLFLEKILTNRVAVTCAITAARRKNILRQKSP